MAKGKLPVARGGGPALRGLFMIDTWRGQMRIRKWPKKRGKPKSLVTKYQSQWFADVARLAGRVAPSQAKLAIEHTKDTGLLPRDLLIHAMAGNLADLELDDGRTITKRENRIYRTMWQGFILNLTATFNFAIGPFVSVEWPLPIRDTAGFWNPGTPNLITIPTGVEVMSFSAGWVAAFPTNALTAAIIFDGANQQYARGQATNMSTPAHSLDTGPINVTPGQTFDLRLLQGAAAQAAAVPATHFSGTILQTS